MFIASSGFSSLSKCVNSEVEGAISCVGVMQMDKVRLTYINEDLIQCLYIYSFYSG